MGLLWYSVLLFHTFWPPRNGRPFFCWMPRLADTLPAGIRRLFLAGKQRTVCVPLLRSYFSAACCVAIDMPLLWSYYSSAYCDAIDIYRTSGAISNGYSMLNRGESVIARSFIPQFWTSAVTLGFNRGFGSTPHPTPEAQDVMMIEDVFASGMERKALMDASAAG